MRHTEVALHRPVTTIVVFVALALMGLIASRLLPLEQFPDIEFPGDDFPDVRAAFFVDGQRLDASELDGSTSTGLELDGEVNFTFTVR